MYASFFDKKNSTKSMAQAMSINTLSVLGATFFGGIIADNISVKFTFFLSSIFSLSPIKEDNPLPSPFFDLNGHQI